MTITLDTMKEKLIPAHDWAQVLKQHENLETLAVKMDGTEGIVQFMLPPGWNVGLKEKDGQALTDAVMGVGEKPYKMTKDAILKVTSMIGLTAAYVAKTPGPLIQQHLNFWATHSFDMDLKFIVKEDEALAVTKAGIEPFSNLTLYNETIANACEKFGIGHEDVWVDFKSSHDLSLSLTRLIFDTSAAERVYSTKRADEDRWNFGIEIRNSLSGNAPLAIRGYLFSWECANGAVSQHNAGHHNRKIMGQKPVEVYEWAQEAVDAVLAGMEHEFDVIGHLTHESLEQGSEKVLADIFRSYKVPKKLRAQIINNYVEAGDFTYFGVMQAITAAANDESMPRDHRTTLMEIGSDLAHNAKDRCPSCKHIV